MRYNASGFQRIGRSLAFQFADVLLGVELNAELLDQGQLRGSLRKTRSIAVVARRGRLNCESPFAGPSAFD